MAGAASGGGLAVGVGLGVEPGVIGGVEIDDVAQQDAAVADGVAPADHRAHGQGALAERLEDHVAAGLDALGDLDLALAGQQLDRAHLAQIHAHRVVGAAEILVADRLGRGLAFLLGLAASASVCSFSLAAAGSSAA